MNYKKFLVTLCFLFVIFSGSCDSFPNTKKHKLLDYKATEQIKQVDKTITDVSKKIVTGTIAIKTETQKIKAEADIVEEKVPEKSKPDISPHIEAIRTSADTIDARTDEIVSLKTDLSSAKNNLKDASSRINNMEKIVDKAVKEKEAAEKKRDEALSKANEATRKMVRWLIIACTIGTGISISLAVFGHLIIGGLLGVASLSTLTFAIMVDKYFDYIAYGALAILALAAIALVWHFFVRNRALKEVVHTTELTKTGMSPSERTRLFGYNAVPGVAYTIQSPSTEKIVHSVRKKLKKIWGHTAPDPADDIDDQEKAIRLERRNGFK